MSSYVTVFFSLKFKPVSPLSNRNRSTCFWMQDFIAFNTENNEKEEWHNFGYSLAVMSEKAGLLMGWGSLSAVDENKKILTFFQVYTWS